MLVFTPFFLLCAVSLIFSRSATSLVSFLMGMLIVSAGILIDKVSRRRRKTVLLSVFFLGGFFCALFFALDIDGLFFQELGRDSTMTGRTYLRIIVTGKQIGRAHV